MTDELKIADISTPDKAINDVPDIDSFSGNFRWLSNFVGAPGLVIKSTAHSNVTANNIEVIYHIDKCCKQEDIELLLEAGTPGKAKKAGKNITLRPDWDEVKLGVMENLVRQKFSSIPFKGLLLGTGDANLEEGNYWHDNYWGVCHCSKCGGNGQNHLGKILMKIREELKQCL